MNYKKTAGFIIKQVQDKSTGFQAAVSIDEISHETGMILGASDVVEVIRELNEREEVADATIDRDSDDLIAGFDVVLYTDHAPNYAGNLEFDLDVCEKCGKFMPEGKLSCKECLSGGLEVT